MTPRGTVHVPGDKSISHRSLMFGALSDGECRISGLLHSADVKSTIDVLAALGVTIRIDATTAIVRGRGIRGLREAVAPLDCGNSGTTARLMAGILAAHPFTSTLTGDVSLSRRPMRRVSEPLEAMGARFSVNGSDGLPMTVHGSTLSSIGWTTKSASAQVKTAILLAALVAQIPVTVTEPRKSRDHTERMLAARGVDVVVDRETISLGVARSLPAIESTVPRDPSSAAFFAALAALAPGGAIDLPHICLNPTRTGFVNVLQRMGAVATQDELSTADGEITGCLRVWGADSLRATSIGASEAATLIDEIPVLACVAARAQGETIIGGASELRVKESDRIAAVVANLRAVGVDASEQPDGMTIVGTDRPLRGRIDSQGDHRLAMAFGVLAALPGNEIEIVDRECVAVSYPNFWNDLARVTS